MAEESASQDRLTCFGGLSLITLCVIGVTCKATSETTLHALWECPVLDEVWADASKWGWRRETAFEGFKELILWIMQNKKNAELFAMTS